MSDSETLLMVGGPHAGRRVKVNLADKVIRMFAHEPRLSRVGEPVESTGPAPEMIEYNRSTWRAGGPPYREWTFLKPKAWTDDQVLDELAANYRPGGAP